MMVFMVIGTTYGSHKGIKLFTNIWAMQRRIE